MHFYEMPPLAKKVLAAAAVAAAYYGLARIGLELALAGTASCPIWPASGFALAAAIALGPEAGLGVFVGSWLANSHAMPGLQAVSPLAAALACAGVALGSALQALTGARLLGGVFRGEDPLARSRDVIRFAALTPVVCLLSASAGIGSLAASGILGQDLLARAWITWWVGDVVGVLITAPLLFAWRPRDTDEFGEPVSPRRAATAMSALAALAFTVWIGFGDILQPGARYPLAFLPFTALIWITLRLDSRGATAGAAVLAALVQWHTVRGLGPFAGDGALNESLLLSSTYIGAAALTAFLLRALLAELNAAHGLLKRRVTAQDEDLWTANAHLRVAALSRREDGLRIQLYRRIVGELPVGIAVLRLDNPSDPESWLIVEVNPAGLRLAGDRGADPTGRRLFDFAPELRDTGLARACAEAMRLDQDVEISDFAGANEPDGSRYSLKIFPLGAPLIGVSFEDVTARRRAEAALARSNAELSQFAYVASHDLQAPLRKAAAFAELIKLRLRNRLDEPSRDFLARMCRSIDGMQSLIDSLLELSQVTAHAAVPQEVDLDEIATEVLGDLEETVRRSGASVERSKLPIVMGDPHQLRRLLQNLLGNALKFTARGRAPRVRLRGRGIEEGRCELVVEDDGVGFEMRFAERIFQPFQRLHGRKDYPGNGMGLAICQKIVERHGGTISVESGIGRGTRFTVVFLSDRPREHEAAPLEAAVH